MINLNIYLFIIIICLCITYNYIYFFEEILAFFHIQVAAFLFRVRIYQDTNRIYATNYHST